MDTASAAVWTCECSILWAAGEKALHGLDVVSRACGPLVLWLSADFVAGAALWTCEWRIFGRGSILDM